MTSPAQNTLRKLILVWMDFERRLSQISFVKKMELGTLSRNDYQTLLLNLRQQVIEGSRWISRAASSFDRDHTEIRSTVIGHARDEHRDYELIEKDYVALGGRLETIQSQSKNIGSEALHAYMMHQASQPNPIEMLGAMFIIEGLGEKMATVWAARLVELGICNAQATQFMSYHGANDANHMEKFYALIEQHAITNEISERIVKTAKVVARLYLLQLEEEEMDESQN